MTGPLGCARLPLVREDIHMSKPQTVGFLVAFRVEAPSGPWLAREVAQVIQEHLAVEDVDVDYLGIIDEYPDPMGD